MIKRTLVGLAGLWAATAVAQGPVLPSSGPELPEVIVDAEIVPDTSGAPARIRGEVTIHALGVGRDVCLYVPYNDPEYGHDRGTARRLEQFQGRAPKAIFEGGESKVEVLSSHVVLPTGPFPFVDRLQGRGPIRLRFDSEVPRLPKSPSDEWFFDGFYPMLARSCANEDYDRLYHRLVAPARHTVHLKIPPGWTFAGPGEAGADGRIVAEASGRTLAFALLRNVITERRRFGSLDVTVHKRAQDFDAILPTAEAALAHLGKMFGPYPHQSLTIVETSELQRHELPGLIAVNQPRQAVFSTAQRDWLNWQHWMMATQLAMQYYGGVVSAASPDDEWLLLGIVEYATLETLRQLPQRFNLFNTTSEGYRWLSFDYLQISEISLSTLAKYAPFARLTDEERRTARPLAGQHGLIFAKHAFAMRQLAAFAGEQPFYGFLRNLTREYSFRALSPEGFAAYLKRLPSPFSPLVRQQLAGFLDRWWMAEGYPDFALDDFETVELEGGKWVARVSVIQKGDIDFPPTVGVEDESGRNYYVRASKAGQGDDLWQVEIITAYEPVTATVDPLHETYDVDRFDNSSKWPDVHFFPGNARTLKDDGYTVMWLPYPFRRPGEPTSLGLQAALFRYTQGSLFLRAEYAPAENLSAVQARHRYELTNLAMYGDLLLEQTYENDRLADLSVVRSPVFPGDPHLALITRARHKHRPGLPESAHASGVLGFSLRPSVTSQDCIYNLSGEIEHAPKELAHGLFMYERKAGTFYFGCSITPRTAASARVFGGSVYKEGEPPTAALFKPNDLREARIRMDLRGLERVSRLVAVNTDLMLPFYLPLPDDTLILSRQMRFRAFYDYGHSYDLDLDYAATGVGLQLPLGGDLSGAGALSFTQLSLLVVLRSQAGDRTSEKPGILFDLSGEL